MTTPSADEGEIGYDDYKININASSVTFYVEFEIPNCDRRNVMVLQHPRYPRYGGILDVTELEGVMPNMPNGVSDKMFTDVMSTIIAWLLATGRFEIEMVEIRKTNPLEGRSSTKIKAMRRAGEWWLVRDVKGKIDTEEL